jgi:hypothetical protein
MNWRVLRAAGWQVEFAEDFRHRLLEVEAWDADLVEAEGGWFDLDMGIIVEGERLPLAPLLAALFRRDGRWLDAGLLAQIADQEMIELVTPGSLRVSCAGVASEAAGSDADRSLRQLSRRQQPASVALRCAAPGGTQRQQSLAVQGTG